MSKDQQGSSGSQEIPPILRSLGFRSEQISISQETTVFTVRGGSGPPLLLLHGWPQDWRVWTSVASLLCDKNEVFCVNLPGIGGSTLWPGGFSTPALAQWIKAIAAAVASSGRMRIAAHDVGAWIGLAAAVFVPECVDLLVLLDSILPGVTPEAAFFLRKGSPAFHFHFHAHPEIAQLLIRGRIREYFNWFMRAKSGYPTFFKESEIDYYAHVYADPGALEAGFEYYKNLPESADKVRSALENQKYRNPLLVL